MPETFDAVIAGREVTFTRVDFAEYAWMDEHGQAGTISEVFAAILYNHFVAGL